MINKNKSNLLLILSFTIFLSFLGYSSYKFIKSDIKNIKSNEEVKQFCLDNEYEGKEYEDFCLTILSKKERNLDFFTMLTNVVVFEFNRFYFGIYLLIIIPSLYYICKYFKNKIILNDLTRNNYKQIMTKILKKSYKSALILPTIILIAYTISYLYTKTLNPEYALLNSTTGWNEYTLTHPALFLVLYLLNMIIHSILYINISLCIARKYHNYFVALILSFLTFIAIEAFLEIVLNVILFITLLHSERGIIFNITNMFSFNDYSGILSPLYVPTTCLIISFLVLYFLYKNKEKLIIDCEKNE